MGGVNDVPVVGQPLAYGVGFLVLLVVGLSAVWGRSLVTVAHEGGHMFVSAAVLRGHRGFTLDERANGLTTLRDGSWGVGDLLTRFAGYATPPLLGLGGAVVVANGNVWGVLAAAVVLLFVAFYYARNGLAFTVTLVVLGAVVWVGLAGSPALQAGVAVAAVWLLLIGGLLDTIRLSIADGTDAYWLMRRTFVPRIVWKGIWIAIAAVSLYLGGRLLLSTGGV